PRFDRVGKRLGLNDTGQWLLPRALELLARAHELEGQLGTDQSIGNLRLGASLTIGNYLATLLVADFLQQHPASRVQLVVHNSASIIEQVAHYELDLGLIERSEEHTSELQSRENLVCRLLLEKKTQTTCMKP